MPTSPPPLSRLPNPLAEEVAFKIVQNAWPIVKDMVQEAPPRFSKGVLGGLAKVLKNAERMPDIEHGAYGLASRARPEEMVQGRRTSIHWPKKYWEFLTEPSPHSRGPYGPVAKYDIHSHPNRTTFSDQDMLNWANKADQSAQPSESFRSYWALPDSGIPDTFEHVVTGGTPSRFLVDQVTPERGLSPSSARALVEMRDELTRFLLEKEPALARTPHPSRAALAKLGKEDLLDFTHKPYSPREEEQLLFLLDQLE